jgi:hypothetical protein
MAEWLTRVNVIARLLDRVPKLHPVPAAPLDRIAGVTISCM